MRIISDAVSLFAPARPGRVALFRIAYPRFSWRNTQCVSRCSREIREISSARELGASRAEWSNRGEYVRMIAVVIKRDESPPRYVARTVSNYHLNAFEKFTAILRIVAVSLAFLSLARPLAHSFSSHECFNKAPSEESSGGLNYGRETRLLAEDLLLLHTALAP